LGFFDTLESYKYLVAGLKDGSLFVVTNALASMSLQGNARAIPDVLPLLASEEPEVQLNACIVLLRLGYSDVRIMDVLRQLKGSRFGIEYDNSCEEHYTISQQAAKVEPDVMLDDGPASISQLIERAIKLKS
jgi:hypothetical protein